MFDNDLLNKFSDAFNEMLGDLDKGLRDGVDYLKDKKSRKSDWDEVFNNKDEASEKKSSPFENLKNSEFFNFENPLNRFRRFHADVVRKDGAVFIHAELPGYEKSNINVDYKNEEIIIRAKRNLDNNPDKSFMESNDRYYGDVERSFKVGKIDVSTIRASFNNGVLTVSCKLPGETSEIKIE